MRNFPWKVVWKFPSDYLYITFVYAAQCNELFRYPVINPCHARRVKVNDEITDCSYELDPANPGDIIGAFPTFNNGAKDQCTSTNGNNGLSTPRGRCCDLRGAASLTCHSEFTGFDRAECTSNDSFIVGCSAVSNGGSSMIEERYIAASGECTTSPGSVAIALWYGFYNANIFYLLCHDRVLSDNRNLLKFLRFMISDQK